MKAPPTEAAWRLELEALMLALEPAQADHLAQVLRESRAAWLLLLPPPHGGSRALVLGDARSGAAAGLVRLGWRVSVLDPVGAQADFASRRGDATGAPIECLTEGPAPGSFDLVLVEEAGQANLEQACAWSRDLVAVTSDNSLGYKRSSGARADFRTTRPLAFLRALAFERAGRLGPQRARLGRLCGSRARAAALYPDRRDFSFVVDLDRAGPALTIGPKERQNRLKLVGHALGLFRHLTPSFGLWASKRERSPARQIDGLLRALEARLGLPPGTHQPAHLVATRGNSALVETDAGWLLRVPLAHCARAATERNAAALESLAERFPELPIPELLFCGELTPAEGGPAVFVSLERRQDGLGAGQLSGNPAAMGRLTEQLGELLATLETAPKRPLDAPAFEQLFGRRFRVVAERVGDADTRAAVAELQAELAHAALGLEVGRVASHRDLRPKHVIAEPTGPHAGELVALVDWSCFDEAGPPLFDLFHLIVQERSQQVGWDSRRAWLALSDRDQLAPPERRAVERYEAALGLDPGWYAVIARAYPVLFGAMAEEHWDYSRPRWLRRVFGIGQPAAG